MTARELVDYLFGSFTEDVIGDTPIASVERQGHRALKLGVEDERGAVTHLVLSVSVTS